MPSKLAAMPRHGLERFLVEVGIVRNAKQCLEAAASDGKEERKQMGRFDKRKPRLVDAVT